MSGYKHWKLQIANMNTGVNDTAPSGILGTVYVAQAGTARKQALFSDKNGTALANPFQMTNGSIEFYTVDTVASVDLYGQTPGGRGFIHKASVAPGLSELFVDTFSRWTELVIPFDAHDQVATVEQDTGFNIPANAVVQPMGLGIDVLTAQAAKTISIGMLSTEASGNATGFANAISLAAATAVFPAATIAAGVLTANTYGALLADYTVGTNTDDRGIFNRKEYLCDGTTISISYTTSAATTTAAGFIKIPYILPSI